MYCEEMSLKGIARVLNIHYKAVVRYFLRASYKAQTANKAYTTIACDAQKQQIRLSKEICYEKHIDIQVLKGENKKIDLSILKLRNDLSRLNRKTICTTKKAERLQNHLDLYIDYHNKNRINTKAA